MRFRLVPKSATLNDLERRNDRYLANKNLTYRKETVRLLHNIEIRGLH